MALEIWFPFNRDSKNYASPYQLDASIPTDQPAPLGKGILCNADRWVKWTDELKDAYINGTMTIMFFMKPFDNVNSVAWSDIVWWKDEVAERRIERGEPMVSANHDLCIYVGTTNAENRGVWKNNDMGIPKTKFIHVAYTIHEGKWELFINGDPFANGVLEATQMLPPTSQIHIGKSTSNEVLSDLRFYSHRVSKKEIKEISKARYFALNWNHPVGYSRNYADPIDSWRDLVVGQDASWRPELHKDALVVDNWSAGWNGGVTDANIVQHAFWRLEDGIPTLILNNNNGAWGRAGNWQGSSSGVNITEEHFPVGTRITISWDQWSSNGSGARVGLHHSVLGSETRGFYHAIQTVDSEVAGRWERVGFTTYIDDQWDLTKGVSMYFYSHYTPDGTLLKCRNAKIHIGEGIDGFSEAGESRHYHLDDTGFWEVSQIDKDSSWIPESPLGTGGVRFNKTGNITANGPGIMPGVGAQVGWGMLRSYASGQSPIFESGAYTSIGAGGQLRAFFYDTDNQGYHLTDAGDVPLNELFMVANVWTGEELKMYVNGVLKRTIPVNSIDGFSKTGNIIIGNNNSRDDRTFDGELYRVMQYGMALSDEDIMNEWKSRGSISRGGSILAHHVTEYDAGSGVTVECYSNGLNSYVAPDDSFGIRVDGREFCDKIRGNHFVVLSPMGIPVQYTWFDTHDAGFGANMAKYVNLLTSAVTYVPATDDVNEVCNLAADWLDSIEPGYYIVHASYDSTKTNDKLWDAFQRNFGLSHPRPSPEYRLNWAFAGRKYGHHIGSYINQNETCGGGFSFFINNKPGMSRKGVYNLVGKNQGIVTKFENIDLGGLPVKMRGKWVRVFRHDIGDGTQYFTDEADVLLKNESNPSAGMYSILTHLEKFRRANGKLTFRMNWPNLDVSQCWSQTSNPITAAVGEVVGLENHRVPSEENGWGGLSRSNRSNSLLDGSPSADTWYYAIGAYVQWGVGFPTWNGSTELVELWVWCEDTPCVSINKYKGTQALGLMTY